MKMNVAKANLDAVVNLLPSLNAPTIAGLYNQEWYSVETVISEDVVRDLIPKLRKSGAEGIMSTRSTRLSEQAGIMVTV